MQCLELLPPDSVSKTTTLASANPLRSKLLVKVSWLEDPICWSGGKSPETRELLKLGPLDETEASNSVGQWSGRIKRERTGTKGKHWLRLELFSLPCATNNADEVPSIAVTLSGVQNCHWFAN